MNELDASLSNININQDISAHSNQIKELKINSELVKTIIQLLKISFDIKK